MPEFLRGMKTIIGGAVLVGGGAAGMVFGVVDPYTGIMLIGNGFAVWGIGAKLERLIIAQKPVDLKGKITDETPN
jgi:hypothetical protein